MFWWNFSKIIVVFFVVHMYVFLRYYFFFIQFFYVRTKDILKIIAIQVYLIQSCCNVKKYGSTFRFKNIRHETCTSSSWNSHTSSSVYMKLHFQQMNTRLNIFSWRKMKLSIINLDAHNKVTQWTCNSTLSI